MGEILQSGLTRRDVLKRGAQAGLAAGGALILAGCTEGPKRKESPTPILPEINMEPVVEEHRKIFLEGILPNLQSSELTEEKMTTIVDFSKSYFSSKLNTFVDDIEVIYAEQDELDSLDDQCGPIELPGIIFGMAEKLERKIYLNRTYFEGRHESSPQYASERAIQLVATSLHELGHASAPLKENPQIPEEMRDPGKILYATRGMNIIWSRDGVQICDLDYHQVLVDLEEYVVHYNAEKMTRDLTLGVNMLGSAYITLDLYKQALHGYYNNDQTIPLRFQQDSDPIGFVRDFGERLLPGEQFPDQLLEIYSFMGGEFGRG